MYEVGLGADEPDKGLDAPPIPPPIPDITGLNNEKMKWKTLFKDLAGVYLVT